MSMRKQRLLQELYNVTRSVPRAKNTPVLRGICRMQGPVDEADCDFNTNMVPSQLYKEYNCCSKNLKSGQRAESGTCNVCFAPCSSCLHINQQLMGSKIDECSGETCTEYASNVSVNDIAPSDKIVKFETEQKSEIRNLESGNSSNTSENVYSEVSLRNSHSSTAHQDVPLQKLDEQKGKGCVDDNMSCITGTEDVKMSDSNASNGVVTDLPSYAASDGTLTPPEKVKMFNHQTSFACQDMECNIGESQNDQGRQSKNSEESSDQMPACLCTPIDLSLRNLGLVEPRVENATDAACLLNAKEGSSPAPCGKSSASDLKETEDLCSRSQGGAEVPSEHLNLLSMKEVVPDIVDSDMAANACQVTVKVAGSCLSPGAKGNSIESHVMDESDESDMVEHDVKVCDICGDTGREDLLAICSRCSDGAEHTYCMREMLLKVPEGDWFCEECKFDVAIENQKQDKVTSADGNEKSSSGQAKPEKPNSSTKSEAKGSSSEGNKASKDPSGVKIPAKRHTEDAEVSSTAKKRILDLNFGPTKTPVSNGVVALSRDNSFRHLDRGKIKPTLQSSCTTIAPESAESPSSSRLQTPQGTFVKSNSFNSLNVKPKIKLVDDVVPQKQRSVRESISLNRKEGAARPIGKSMSFKYTNSTRLNSSESKVKMLPSKFPSIQDIRGSKNTKDLNLFERKNSFNAERTSVNSYMATSSSLTAKSDKKLALGADASLLSSVRSHRDMKPVQSDNKSMTLSRSSSFAVRKGSEMPVSLGEVKKHSSQLATTIGVSSTNATGSSDMKPKPSSPKEDSSSSSCIADRPPCNASESLPDGFSRLKESTSFCERGKESSVSRSKQSSASGRTVRTPDCPASPASDASAAKSSREIVEGKDKLKAAIEAAVLRKPGIYRKHRVLDPSDDVSVSSINSEIAPQDHILNSGNKGNASALEIMSEGRMIRENSSTDSCKQTIEDAIKQSEMHHVDASASKMSDAYQGIPTEGSSLIKDMPGQVPNAISIHLETLAIPDYEYIWQGNFEVYRNGKPLKFYDGIQAHLSSCASTKVLEAVNKIPHKLILNEVPRLSTWPRLFQEYGAKEDNIALFFFAKDLLSYEKSYKTLLDNMMKNDLALRGNLDDVELMIFPSNQLPEKFQRWNTLFFLWGVFRGKRTGSSENVPSSQKQIHYAHTIPTAIMSLPENICSVRPVDKDSSECGESASASEASRDFPCLSSLRKLDGDCDIRASSHIQPDYHMQTVIGKQDQRVDSSSFLVVKSGIPESCEEVDIIASRKEVPLPSTFLDVGVEPLGKLEEAVQNSAEATIRTPGFDKGEQMPRGGESSLSRRHSLPQLEESKADGHGSLGEINTSDKISTSQYQVDLDNGPVLDSPPCGNIDRNVKDSRKRQHVEMVERVSGTAAAGASPDHAIPGNGTDAKSIEEVHTIKRRKSDFCGMYGGSDQTSSAIEGGYMRGIDNVVSGSPLGADCRAEGFDGTDVHGFEGNAERYFFPVGPHAEEIDINKAAQSVSWKLNPLEDDRLHDKVPNLELALGAETKPLMQGMPTFLVGKEEKKMSQDPCSHEGTSKGEEDEESASLSLSLSFPFPGEEERVRSMSDTEKQRVNTSLLLFGGLRDK